MKERGQFATVTVVIVIVLILAVIGLFAVCTPGEDDHGNDGLGRLQLVSHEYDGGDCDWNGDCGGGYDERNGGYGDGRGGDGRFGGGRSGDYDGGDGDGDRCRNICNNTFPLPGGGGGNRR